MYMSCTRYMLNQSTRQGIAKQLHPKTAAASRSIQTRNVLRTRQMLYQLSHRGSSAGQVESSLYKGDGLMAAYSLSPLMSSRATFPKVLAMFPMTVKIWISGDPIAMET